MTIISKVGSNAGNVVYYSLNRLAGNMRTGHVVPEVKCFKSGTTIVRRPGIKTVAPTKNSKLGQMGVTAITCFSKGYFPHSGKLISIDLQGSKQSAGLFTPKEAMLFLKQLKELQQELLTGIKNPEKLKKYVF